MTLSKEAAIEMPTKIAANSGTSPYTLNSLYCITSGYAVAVCWAGATAREVKVLYQPHGGEGK
jgi:hypothetical protein